MNHNRVRLLRGGSEYFDALEELIAKAQYTIYLQVYIFDDDATGIRVGNALIEAAKRGVSVFVLADGYASQSLSRVVISSWQKAGIHFRFFEPLLRSTRFYFGRRLHHKIVVVDAQYGLVGGMNIADRYNDVGDERAWLDFAV
ncbi:MAG TPA: phospholipase D-like domain-containing protein, partial [Flavisolibacter sp.]